MADELLTQLMRARVGEAVEYWRGMLCADRCGTGGVMTNDAARAYALRVWQGQSIDVPDHVRRERVRRALEAQGWTMEGVTL